MRCSSAARRLHGRRESGEGAVVERVLVLPPAPEAAHVCSASKPVDSTVCAVVRPGIQPAARGPVPSQSVVGCWLLCIHVVNRELL